MSEGQATRVINAFETPIVMRQRSGVEAVNEGLKRLILERRAQDQGVDRSNSGGWHSRHDLLDWGGDEIAKLKSWIREAVTDVTVANKSVPRDLVVFTKLIAWANVSQRGNFNKVHNHPRSDWSGVYYVTVGEPDPDMPGNGTIEFLDPRGGGVGMMSTFGYDFGRKVQIGAQHSLMLIFPSWLLHMVNPYEGPGERISIAFNASVEKAPRQLPGLGDSDNSAPSGPDT